MKSIYLDSKKEYTARPLLTDPKADALFYLGGFLDVDKGLSFVPGNKGGTYVPDDTSVPNSERVAQDGQYLVLPVPLNQWQLFKNAYLEGGLSVWGLAGMSRGAYDKTFLRYGGTDEKVHQLQFSTGEDNGSWNYNGIAPRYQTYNFKSARPMYTSNNPAIFMYGKMFLEECILKSNSKGIIQIQVADAMVIAGTVTIDVSGGGGTTANPVTPITSTTSTAASGGAGSKNNSTMSEMAYNISRGNITGPTGVYNSWSVDSCKPGRIGDRVGGSIFGEDIDTLMSTEEGKRTARAENFRRAPQGMKGGGGGGGLIIIEARKIQGGVTYDEDGNKRDNKLIIKARGHDANGVSGAGGLVIFKYNEMVDFSPSDISIDVSSVGTGGATAGISIFEGGW